MRDSFLSISKARQSISLFAVVRQHNILENTGSEEMCVKIANILF